MIHELKISDNFFADIASGKKTFHATEKDRDYKVGDLLALNEVVFVEETKPEYTGRSMLVYVDYILDYTLYESTSYFPSKQIIMSIKPCMVGYVTSPRDMMKLCGADYSVQILERGEWEKQ